MKKRISILALLCLTLATLAFGVDKLITAPSGDLILDAKTGQKIVIKKEIEAQVQSPGFVPIGGMVAVMPHVSGSWQPPASGAVKDGFMRADGSTVTDGDSPLNGEVLPNMASNTYARGDSTSGGSGGSNTQASNVTVGNHTALSLSNHSDINIAHGHGFTNPSVPAHYHSNGTGSNAATSLGVSGGTCSGTFAAHTHTHNMQHMHQWNYRTDEGGWSQYYAIENPNNAYNRTSGFTTASPASVYLSASTGQSGSGFVANTTNSTPSDSWYTTNTMDASANSKPNTGNNSLSASVVSTAAELTGSNTVTGNFGLVTGGSNGNTSFSTTGGGVAALGETNKSISAHSFSQNIDSHNVTNNAVNNEPKYLSVVWVIRVK